MSKINFSKFHELSDRAEQYNREYGAKRFYIINSSQKRGLTTFGLYDYKLKRYVVSHPGSDLNSIFDEIEEMLEK